MISAIINGISNAISTEFGSVYEIYTETIEQGLKEPCFSIACINLTAEQFLGKRYFRKNQFCIHYFSKTEEKQAECCAVSERLFNALEMITVGNDSVRGTNMHFEFADDVLNFFVNYDVFVYKEQVKAPEMEIAQYKNSVKGKD